MKKFIAYLLSISFFVFSLPLMNVTAKSNVYYVATNGNDSNSGLSIESPFKTISKASQVMSGGDICYIRGGTYRETVTPANSGSAGSPITFENYNDENVVISGADGGLSWNVYNGNIFYCDVVLDMNDSNQIFFNGEMMHQARWPNAGSDLFDLNMAVVDSGSEISITDSDLNGSDNYWAGATLWTLSGAEWCSKYSTVTSSNGNTIYFDEISGTSYAPKSGNKYYLTGLLSELDEEGEWFYDGNNSRLYFWAPGGVNPTNGNFEYRSRNVGFDLSSKSYINLKGIDFFSCSLTTNASTSYCNLENVNMKYVAHGFVADGSIGVDINGSHIKIINSIFDTAYGCIMRINGNNNSLINSIVRNGNYGARWNPMVQVNGRAQLVSNCTIYNCGRAALGVKGQNCVIQYNDIYNAGYLQTDFGVINFGTSDGGNTRIHHNYVHDTKNSDIDFGIYLDNGCENFIIDHNVIYNCNSGIKLNTPSRYEQIYNNTVVADSGTSMNYWGNTSDADDGYGTRVFNNIFTSAIKCAGGAVVGNNVFLDSGDLNADFTLALGSEAIGSGMVIDGITSGASPDCGAFEYGAEKWTAGCDLTAENLNVTYEAPVITEYSNHVVNSSFENGLYGWTKTGSNTATVVYSSSLGNENAYAKSQYYGLRLGNGDGVEQTVSGLLPNTDYILSCWVKVPHGESVSVSVEVTDGRMAQSSNETLWRQIEVPFKTGVNETLCKIRICKTSNSSAMVYADTIGIQKLDPNMGIQDMAEWSSNADGVYKDMAYTYFKKVSIDFYDTNDNSVDKQIIVNSKNDSRQTMTAALEINSSLSEKYYTYSFNGVSYVSNVLRTNGNHNFCFDYTDAGMVVLYIDYVQVGAKSNYWGFDGINLNGVVDKINIRDLTYKDMGFEHSLGGWYSENIPKISSAVKHNGRRSVQMDKDVSNLSKKSQNLQSGIVTMWFYDNCSNSRKFMARVDNENEILGLGMDTGVSSNYVLFKGCETVETSVPASTGWHRLVWDYSSNEVVMYIDGVKVGEYIGYTNYNYIALGDFWSDGIVSNVYFDDVTYKVQEDVTNTRVNLYTDDFDTFEDTYIFSHNVEYMGYTVSTRTSAGVQTGIVSIEPKDGNYALRIQEQIVPGTAIGWITVSRSIQEELPESGSLQFKFDINFEQNIYALTSFPSFFFNTESATDKVAARLTTNYSGGLKMSEYPTGTANYGRVIDQIGTFNNSSLTFTSGNYTNKWISVEYKFNLSDNTYDVLSYLRNTGDVLFRYSDIPYCIAIGSEKLKEISKLFFRVEETQSYISSDVPNGVYWIDNLECTYFGDVSTLNNKFGFYASLDNEIINSIAEAAGKTIDIVYNNVDKNDKRYKYLFGLYDDNGRLMKIAQAPSYVLKPKSVRMNIPSNVSDGWYLKGFCWSGFNDIMPVN